MILLILVLSLVAHNNDFKPFPPRSITIKPFGSLKSDPEIVTMVDSFGTPGNLHTSSLWGFQRLISCYPGGLSEVEEATFVFVCTDPSTGL